MNDRRSPEPETSLNQPRHPFPLESQTLNSSQNLDRLQPQTLFSYLKNLFSYQPPLKQIFDVGDLTT